MANLRRLADLARRVLRLPDDLDDVKTALARHHHNALTSWPDLTDPRIAEYRAFSQFGEDGILLYILTRIEGVPKRFVEFGVEDYREASTRLLAELGGWAGFVMDASPRNIRRLNRDSIMWRTRLTAAAAFVTADNIETLLSGAGFNRDLGVLVVDIDGNDYWIWKAIQETRPVIAVVEYNALWGLDHPVSTPYLPAFNRLEAHRSGLYGGASLPALVNLADAKGYRLVAVNSQANNAFFLRSDTPSSIRTIHLEPWMANPGFQQARSDSGRLTLEGDERAVQALARLPLVDVVTGDTLQVGDVLSTRRPHS